MADRISASARSEIMSRIRGKNTTPERYMFAAMRAAGWRFITHPTNVTGRPDAILQRARLAIFIDGDFWHGYRFPQWKACLPERWQEKIEGNRKRDQRVRRQLRRQGWKVVRLWEHEIEKDLLKCLYRIQSAAELPLFDECRVRKRMAVLPPLKHRNRLPRPKKENR